MDVHALAAREGASVHIHLHETAAAIADTLHISPRTVANHKQNIYAKMGVKTTSEMIYKAKEEGLL